MWAWRKLLRSERSFPAGLRRGSAKRRTWKAGVFLGVEGDPSAPDVRSGQTPFVGCLVNHNTPPLFFVSVASNGLNIFVSPVVATLTRRSISVADKGLRGIRGPKHPSPDVFETI
jgi:hypothetical protein